MAIYALDYVAANAQRGSFSDSAMVMTAGTDTTLVFSIDLTTKADTFHYIISTDTGLTTSNVNIYYSQSSGNLAINMGTNLFYAMPAGFESAGERYLLAWHKTAGNLNEVWIVKQDGVDTATSLGSFSDAESIPGTRTWQVANRQDNTAARYANAEVGMLAKFDRALTTQEMEDLAHYVVEAKDLTNCAIYYPYSEGSGTTATDTQQGAVFTTVNNPGWVLLDGGGAITVTGQTPSFTYSAASGTVDLTGEISVTGQTPTFSYSAIAGSVDLTSEITVTGQTPTFSYSAAAGSVELAGAITVTGQTPSFSYAPVAGDVTLQGTIEVTGQTPSFSYSGIKGVVTVGAPDFAVNFSGTIKQSEFSGSLKQAVFSGTIEQATFSGLIKTAAFTGVRK